MLYAIIYFQHTEDGKIYMSAEDGYNMTDIANTLCSRVQEIVESYSDWEYYGVRVVEDARDRHDAWQLGLNNGYQNLEL